MLHEQEVRQRIRAAVDGDMSLDELEGWLDDNERLMFIGSSRAAIRLAAGAQLLFSERDDGARSDESVRVELWALLGCPLPTAAPAPSAAQTAISMTVSIGAGLQSIGDGVESALIAVWGLIDSGPVPASASSIPIGAVDQQLPHVQVASRSANSSAGPEVRPPAVLAA